MLISDIEKASTKFKQTHKVSVSGPFDEEQPPKWFLAYMENFKQEFRKELKHEIKKINDRIDNLVKLNNLKE